MNPTVFTHSSKKASDHPHFLLFLDQHIQLCTKSAQFYPPCACGSVLFNHAVTDFLQDIMILGNNSHNLSAALSLLFLCSLFNISINSSEVSRQFLRKHSLHKLLVWMEKLKNKTNLECFLSKAINPHYSQVPSSILIHTFMHHLAGFHMPLFPYNEEDNNNLYNIITE